MLASEVGRHGVLQTGVRAPLPQTLGRNMEKWEQPLCPPVYLCHTPHLLAIQLSFVFGAMGATKLLGLLWRCCCRCISLMELSATYSCVGLQLKCVA
jgi:hypothetical protein